MPNEKRPRIVTLDIETCPLRSYHWALFDQNIGLEQIDLDWSILSFSYKWLGAKQVYFESTGGRGPGKVRDDGRVMKSLWHLLDQADIVVAQNGVAFDLKKINARLIQLGYKPYAPVKVIDTMLAAKRHFAFSSNKLAWLSSILGATKKDEHKKFPGFELWAECLKDNPDAWAEMEKYNKVDVVGTEEVYLKLRPWIEGHPNVAVYEPQSVKSCPKCGSANLRLEGHAFTQTGEYQRYQCRECGGWSRARNSLNRAESGKLLTN